MSEVLATIHPRPARRWAGIVIQSALGVLVISIATALPEGNLLAGLVLLVIGCVMLWGAFGIYRSTRLHIELTETELRDSSGAVLARVDEIRGIDRGAFAFKPSHGFLVRLKSAAPRHWAPGLWWRIGRFVGVGGVTPAGEAKAVAEILAVLIAREQESRD